MEEQISVEKLKVQPQSGDTFDAIIIGSGPAGMSAAVCAGRANLKVLLIDNTLPGGSASTAYRVTNYLGFPGGVLGDDLSRNMEEHLNDYDIVYVSETVEDILNIHEKVKTVRTDMGSFYKTKGIILAHGLEPKKLGSDFERNFLGRGISYYAQGDVESYAGKDVAVIGGGNCACYAADYLSEHVNKLYLIHRSDFIKSVKSLKTKVMDNPKIDILWNTEPVDGFGVDRLEKIKLQNVVTQQHTWLDIKCAFIYVGRIPPTDVISVDIETDENGFIITDECMRTNVRGVYAAGDIRSKQIRQIATAVADGMIAAVNIEKDLLQ